MFLCVINYLYFKVEDRRRNVRHAGKERLRMLDLALLHAEFLAESATTNGWIREKEANLASCANTDHTSVREKVKRLQKLEAFMAEMQAHQSIVQAIADKGESLLAMEHPNSVEVKHEVESLIQKWQDLNNAANKRYRDFGEAQDIMNFELELEKLDQWIREKVRILGSYTDIIILIDM